MIRARDLAISLLCGGMVCFSVGCLALSFGGKTQTVDHVVSESPETLARIDSLESRVQTLERQLVPQESLPGSRAFSK
ncbi:MAG: hypothetical protein JWM11_3791 [Planctomycetaceae bacterium]|nr:hypothetical protein [Planctomycetaceae bacterium]